MQLVYWYISYFIDLHFLSRRIIVLNISTSIYVKRKHTFMRNMQRSIFNIEMNYHVSLL